MRELKQSLDAPLPRPTKAVDVLEKMDVEQDDREFDPNVDISKKDKEAMLKQLEEFHETGSVVDLCKMIFFVGFLYPDIVIKFFDEKTIDSIEKMSFDYNSTKGFDFVDVAVAVVLFSPKHRANLFLNGYKNRILKQVRGKSNLYKWKYNIATRLTMLYPDLKNTMFRSPTQDELAGMPSWINSASYVPTLDFLDDLREKGVFEYYAPMAMEYVLFVADGKNALNTDSDTFDKMRQCLYKYCKLNDWYNFSRHAMALTVLAAEKAELTSDGRIKLTHKPGKVIKDRKPLPERSHI